MLQRGSHLAGVHGIDARVADRRREQHRGVMHAWLHTVIGRVSVEPRKLTRIFGGTVFGHPRFAIKRCCAACR
jgi:hypothetical protein